MLPTVQVGTVLIEEQLPASQALGLESESYVKHWDAIKSLDGFALDRKIHAAGWNFVYMATEVKATFLGQLGAKKIRNALRRILTKVQHQGCNSLEVTGIVAKHFLGVPYTVVSAHSRHIQESCYMNGAEGPHRFHREVPWVPIRGMKP